MGSDNLTRGGRLRVSQSMSSLAFLAQSAPAVRRSRRHSISTNSSPIVNVSQDLDAFLTQLYEDFLVMVSTSPNQSLIEPCDVNRIGICEPAENICDLSVLDSKGAEDMSGALSTPDVPLSWRNSIARYLCEIRLATVEDEDFRQLFYRDSAYSKPTYSTGAYRNSILGPSRRKERVSGYGSKNGVSVIAPPIHAVAKAGLMSYSG